MNNIQLYLGDSKEILRGIESNSIDLLLTDPPYGYSFMGKDWDKVLPSIEIWKECYRVLKLGAFAFVMSAPRQDVMSRMMIRLEEAGFRIDFTSIYWTYASGFPKAINIGKMIDKRLGKKREVIGDRKRNIKPYNDKKGWNPNNTKGNYKYTKGTSPAEGSYGGFQPKPAVEIIIVAMKPLSEKTYVDQALKNGKGITWLDDCKIPYKDEKDIIPQIRDNKREVNAGKMYRGNSLLESKTKATIGGNEKGRFPANLLVSDDSLNDGKIMGGKSGKIPHKYNKNYKETLYTTNQNKPNSPSSYGDKGSYSRYFDLDKWFSEKIKQLPESVKKVFPFFIVPKASKSEKNKGCENLEKKNVQPAGLVGAINKGTEKPREKRNNNHPTVKPIKLMSYLITLGSRKNDVVLDPFMGSGSTGIACKLLNRKFIGIELSEEYIKIAQARIKGNAKE